MLPGRFFPTAGLPFLLLISMLAFPLFSTKYRYPLKIERVYSQKGLSEQSIHCIVQDKKGFLWIGTGDGLNRFDGYEFKVYKHNPFDSNTISDNYILALCEDREGMLWVGTRNGGLNRFDWRHETFRHFLPLSDDTKSISDGYISAILEDRRGRLWVGTVQGGLNRMVLPDLQFVHYKFDPSAPNSIGHNFILSIYEDHSGTIWVGTHGGGLNRFEEETAGFTRFQHDPTDPFSLSDNDVWCVYEDSGGILWVGTAAGLNRYDKQKNRFFRHAHDRECPASLSHNLVSSIEEDHRGMLWIGTGIINKVGNGLNIFDRETERIYRQHLPGVSGGDRQVSVFTLFKDRVGTLWIGTIGEGLYKYDPHKYKFIHIKHEPGSANTLSGNNVWAIHEDSGGNLWIGVMGGGLNFLNRKTHQFSCYTHNPLDPDSLVDNSVRVIMEDRQGYLWIGTDIGLDRFERRRGRFVHFPAETGTEDSPRGAKISVLFEGSDGCLWVGTWGKGIFRFDPGTKNWTRYIHDSKDPFSLSGNKVTAISEDGQRRLWVGTISNGLNYLDPGTDRFYRFKKNSGTRQGLSSNAVTSIYQDTPGVVWIGTWGGGLNRLDVLKGTFTCFNQERNQDTSSIYSVLGDHSGNLWLSTNNGIFKFDPGSKSLTNYTEEDGLQANEFNQGAFYQSPSGEMFLGGINGFNCFFPENITPNSNIPRIVLLDFKIFGKSIKTDKQNRLNYKSSDEIHIRLNHRENHFSFEFAALEYTNPQNNQYAYMMEGLDPDWIYCGTRRYANYTNLEGGDYIFRVIGSNNDGLWNTRGIAVKITIVPPIWQTGWFRILVILILAFGIGVIYWWRTEKLKEKIKLQKEIQRVLKRSRNDLQKAKELIELRHAEIIKLVSAISSILIAIDGEGKIYQWNRPAETFFSTSASAVTGKRFTEVASRWFQGKDLDWIMQTGMTQQADTQREFQVNVGDSRRLLSVIFNPIANRNGEKRGLLVLGEDITLRRAEEARKNLLLKLKSIGQMHAGISHEINTPLQSIQINGRVISDFFAMLVQFREDIHQCLRSGKFYSSLESSLEAVDMINTGVRQIVEITRGMREFFHPGSDRMERCSINELLKSTIIVSRYKIQKVADIEARLDENLSLTLCYPAQLNQVFLNVILNAADAIKETRNRGLIVASTSAKRREIIIRISDTGPGIPADLGEKIFTPFFTTKGMGKGMGMGLSMTKKIVEENHGGKIYFNSRPGRGTTFFIHLPFREVEE